MWINPSSGLITWVPALADLGATFLVTVQVSDPFLGVGTQSFEVLVTPDTQAPTVNISFIDGVYVNLNNQNWWRSSTSSSACVCRPRTMSA
jgi:hypothetical protein